jgi:hypothetical protein
VDADDLAFALTALALGVVTAIDTGVGFDPVRVWGAVQLLAARFVTKGQSGRPNGRLPG